MWSIKRKSNYPHEDSILCSVHNVGTGSNKISLKRQNDILIIISTNIEYTHESAAVISIFLIIFIYIALIFEVHTIHIEKQKAMGAWNSSSYIKFLFKVEIQSKECQQKKKQRKNIPSEMFQKEPRKKEYKQK